MTGMCYLVLAIASLMMVIVYAVDIAQCKSCPGGKIPKKSAFCCFCYILIFGSELGLFASYTGAS